MEEQLQPGCCRRLMAKLCPPFYKEELKSTLKIGWAIVATQLLAITFQATAVMFGGHLGKEELAVIALSVTLVNVLGNSIVIGLSTCCETVFSQSFGNGNHKMIGIYLQRSLYIHILAMLPCYAIHLNIEQILLAVGQKPNIAEQTGRYLLYFMPGLMCLCLFTVLRKYTQCQNIVIPHIFILLSGHMVHALCQYLCLYQFHLGIVGSAIAQDITFFYILMVTIAYTACSKVHKQSWPGWDVRGLMDWGPLARLAVYGLLMVIFEWWSFEISIFVAGYLGETELGAQSATFHLDTLYYGFIFGIGVATTIRVGQLLGAGEPTRAKTSAFVGFSLMGAQACLLAILYGTARHQLPRLFTGDQEVIDMMASILPVLALYVIVGSLNIAGRAVFRGMGWQRLGSVVSFISFYVFSWPVALPLTLCTSLSIVGMWWGFFVGISLSAIFFILCISCYADWEKVSEQAMALANSKRSASKSAMGGEQRVNFSEKTPILTANGPHEDTNYDDKFDAIVPETDEDLDNTSHTEALENESATLTKHLIITRLMTVLVFLLILGAGLTIRLTTTSNLRRDADIDVNATTGAYDDITTMGWS